MQRRAYIKQLLTLAACATVSPLSWSNQDTANQQSLRGRVWDANHQQWLSERQLQNLLFTASSVIVGERHDNSQHHRIERLIIDTLAQAGKLGGVAMEMLDREQQALIDAKSNRYWRSLDDAQLQSALAWQKGWDWDAYGPTIKRVFALDKPLLGANVVNDEVRTLVRANAAPDIPAPIVKFQQSAIVEGHCGLLPDDMIDGMLAVQVARDRAMAEALGGLPHTGVLICGAGHARRDIGASHYMTNKPLTIGLIEVEPQIISPEQAQPTSIDAAPAFDIMWFTRAQQRDDPCASLRARFAEDD